MHLFIFYGLCTLHAVTFSVNITLLPNAAALDSYPGESSLSTPQHGLIRATQQERHKNIKNEGKEIVELAQ